MSISIEPIQQGLGGVVKGVNLAEPLSAEQMETIQAAWWELGVLAFPDQDLSPEQQAAFSAQFGSCLLYTSPSPRDS